MRTLNQKRLQFWNAFQGHGMATKTLFQLWLSGPNSPVTPSGNEHTQCSSPIPTHTPMGMPDGSIPLLALGVYRLRAASISQRCVYRKLDSTVLMVEAAKKRSRCDHAKKLGGAMERGILGQGPVSPEAVVVVGICAQDPAQVGFAQDHDMVQAFSSDRADKAFDMSVLPRRSRCRWSVADTHGRETSGYWMAVRGVSIPDEISRRLFPGEGLGDLAGDPVGGRVGRDIDPYQLASVKPDDHQTIEQLKAGRRHHEQVDGADVRHVVAQEGLPALRWWAPSSDHVLGHCRLGDLEAQPEQLVVDARRTPVLTRN
jgi:hypothetical protein